VTAIPIQNRTILPFARSNNSCSRVRSVLLHKKGTRLDELAKIKEASTLFTNKQDFQETQRSKRFSMAGRTSIDVIQMNAE